MLPSGVREPAALGYAFARDADDVADDASRSPDERVADLERRRLSLSGLDPELHETLDEILRGMQREIRGESDLADHLYVAGGIVGRYLAALFHRVRGVPLNLEDAIAFGEGLELVNVIRDRKGETWLAPDADIAAVARDALDRLTRGWRYVESIPHGEFRLKLSCAWPALIAVETLEASVRRAGAKIGRARVRRIVAESTFSWLQGRERLSWTYRRRAEKCSLGLRTIPLK